MRCKRRISTPPGWWFSPRPRPPCAGRKPPSRSAPADIEGAPLYSVDYSARAQDNDRLLRLLEAYDVSDGSEQPIRNAIGGPRLQLIRDAASARLLAVAPDPGDITGRGASSFWSSVGGGVPEDRAPFAAAIYNRVAMAVTFQRPDGEAYSLGGRQAIQFGPDEDLCVKVTYLLHCTAPLVSGFFCDTYASIRASRPQSALDSLAAARRSGDPDRIRRTTATLRSAERDIRRQSGYLDALEYAEAPWAGWLFDDRARFRVITSHACGRLQGGTHDPCAEGA